jgi:hypothetical protein
MYENISIVSIPAQEGHNRLLKGRRKMVSNISRRGATSSKSAIGRTEVRQVWAERGHRAMQELNM